MSDRRPGAVVVGTGFGCRIHVPAVRAAGMEVVALVGRDRARVERRAARAGVERACGSLEEALRIPGSDVVIVATPPDTHAELATAAIAAGRHVLVEKPFTTTVREAEELVRAAASAGVTALVGHEFRFAPERIAVMRAIRDDLVGPPRVATFVGHMSFMAPVDAPAPPWWFDTGRGGGWLGASVSHLVDAIRVWLGEFDSVSAALPVLSGRDPATHAEDTVTARFRLLSGCEGVLQQSAAMWGERVEVIRVAGPRGTVTLTGEAVTLANSEGTEPLDHLAPAQVQALLPSDDPRHRFTHIELGPASVQAEILRDLVLGRQPGFDAVAPAEFTDGLACMRVLEAVRVSAGDAGTNVRVAGGGTRANQ